MTTLASGLGLTRWWSEENQTCASARAPGADYRATEPGVRERAGCWRTIDREKDEVQIPSHNQGTLVSDAATLAPPYLRSHSSRVHKLLPSIARSIANTPSRWSISCCNSSENAPAASSRSTSPASFWKRHRTSAERSSRTSRSGNEKQSSHSSNFSAL